MIFIPKTRRTICFRPFSALVSGLRKGQYQGSPHNSVRTEPEVPSRRLSFVGVSMTDVWEAIQEEDGKKPFKKTMEKAKKSTSRYWKNTDEIWENRVFWKKKTVVNQDDNLHTHWWKEGWRKTTTFFSSKGNLWSREEFLQGVFGSQSRRKPTFGRGSVKRVIWAHLVEANVSTRKRTFFFEIAYSFSHVSVESGWKVNATRWAPTIVVNWVINGPCKLAFK